MTSRTDRRLIRSALCAVLAVCTLASAGCNYLGPVIFFIEGPPKVEAEFKLPKERTAVVLIDDPPVAALFVRPPAEHAEERHALPISREHAIKT